MKKSFIILALVLARIVEVTKADFTFGKPTNLGSTVNSSSEDAVPTISGDGRSLRSWLYKSVRFSCLDEIRRRGRRPEDPTDVLPPIEEWGPELPDPILRDALMQLSERQRTIVLLRHVAGFSVGEIARIIVS